MEEVSAKSLKQGTGTQGWGRDPKVSLSMHWSMISSLEASSPPLSTTVLEIRGGVYNSNAFMVLEIHIQFFTKIKINQGMIGTPEIQS